MRVSEHKPFFDVAAEKLFLNNQYVFYKDVLNKLKDQKNYPVVVELFNILLQSFKDKYLLDRYSKLTAKKIIEIISQKTICAQPLENFKGIYKQLRATKLLKHVVQKGEISPKLAAMYRPEQSLSSIKKKIRKLENTPYYKPIADLLSKYMYCGKIKLPDENLEEMAPFISELANLYLGEKKAEKFVMAVQEAKNNPQVIFSLNSFNKEALRFLLECPNLKKLELSLEGLLKIDSSSLEILEKLLSKKVKIKILNKGNDLFFDSFPLRLYNLKHFCKGKSPQIKLEGTPWSSGEDVRHELLIRNECLKIRFLSDFKVLEHPDSKYLEELPIECREPLNTYACSVLGRLPVQNLIFDKATSFVPSESDLNFLLDMSCLKTLDLPLEIVLKLPPKAIEVLHKLHEKEIEWAYGCFFNGVIDLTNPKIQPETLTALLKYAKQIGETHLQKLLDENLNGHFIKFPSGIEKIKCMNKFKEFSVKFLEIEKLQDLDILKEIPDINTIFFHCDLVSQERLEEFCKLADLQNFKELAFDFSLMFHEEDILPVLKTLLKKGVDLKIYCKEKHFLDKNWTSLQINDILNFARQHELKKLEKDILDIIQIEFLTYDRQSCKFLEKVKHLEAFSLNTLNVNLDRGFQERIFQQLNELQLSTLKELTFKSSCTIFNFELYRGGPSVRPSEYTKLKTSDFCLLEGLTSLEKLDLSRVEAEKRGLSLEPLLKLPCLKTLILPKNWENHKEESGMESMEESVMESFKKKGVEVSYS